MDCYTVDESIRPGIRMQISNSGKPFVPVGRKQIPVSDGIVKGVQRVIDVIQDDNEALSEVVNYSGLALTTAELRANGAMLCRQRKAYKNPRALVLLQTEAETPSDLKLTSRSFIERQASPKKPWLPVKREYGPFPSVGIEVIATCGTNCLLVMSQNSGFRIHRTGTLEDDYARTITLALGKSGLTMKNA